MEFFKIDGISKIGLETVYEAHYQAILTYIIFSVATGCLAKCGVKPDEMETEKNVEDGTFENPAYIEESEINTQNNDGKKPPPRLSTVDLNDEKITVKME